MKKELQELGLLNTKTLTKLVFYNERLAFLCRSDRSRGVSSALSWYPSVVARTWCKNDKVSWRGLKTVVNLPQKSETKKQGYEDKEQCYCKSALQSDIIYEPQETTIAPGMMLTLYTDGLTEAFNAQEQQFGRERFVQLIRRCSGMAPKELVDTAITEVQHFAINTEQSDDLTLLVVCYKPTVKAG